MITSFGEFLRHLRRRAGMTQSDLAAAVGFSEAQISRLEKNERLPDVTMVATQFVAALALQEEPQLAFHLIELAALARGEKPPTSLTIQRTVQTTPLIPIQASPGHLPLPPTPLFGRARELDQICKRMVGHNGRLFTLIGPPGVGKTRLALAVGTALQPLYADGVYFVALAAVSDATHLVTTLLAALHLTVKGNKPPMQQLIEGVRHRQLLLVLDNFEQLHPVAPLIAELLAACGALHLLVTSRIALRVRGEQRYPVAPLAVADAATLFVERAQAIDPSFAPTAAEQSAIDAICRRLDCLPLAIELSASQIDLFALPELLRRLQDSRLDLPATGLGDLPDQHRTLRHAIDRSYRLLSTEEQKLFCGLGLFVGSFDLAVVVGLGYGERALQGLIQKSLVHSAARSLTTEIIADQRRFLLLETLRDYAIEQLHSGGEEFAVRQRHATYFSALAELAAVEMRGKDKAHWLSRLDADLDNLRVAFQWLRQVAPIEALALAGALKEFWYLRSYFQEGQQWLVQALADCADYTADAGQSSAWRARALLALAQITQHLGDYHQALQLVDESMERYLQADDQWGQAEAERESGWILLGLGQRASAVARFEASLARFRIVGDQVKIAAVLIALAYIQNGDDVDDLRARAYLRESIVLLQTLGDPDALCFALHLQGEMALVAGEFAVADETLQQMLMMASTNVLRRQQAMALTALAKSNVKQGRWASASAYGEEGLQIALAIGDKDRMMAGHCYLGHVRRAADNRPEALLHYGTAFALALALENHHFAAEALQGCGAIALAHGANTVAVQLWSAATRLLDVTPPHIKDKDRSFLFEPLARLKAQMPPADYAAAWMIGERWSSDEMAGAVQWLCRSQWP